MNKVRFKILTKISWVICVSFLTGTPVKSQPTAGTTGLLNIPTAQMQQDGTFMMGANYLPDIITPKPFNYNTGNYYFNITFLPFLEINYKMTLFKVNNRYNHQDRSFALRMRLLEENRILPSLVVGANDVYTSAEKGNQHFGAMYAVATRHFMLSENKLGITIGYGFVPFRNNRYVGLFGGISFSPYFFNQLDLMAEYDSEHFNLGGSLLIAKHIYLVSFTCDFKNTVGGVACILRLGKDAKAKTP